MHLVMIHRSGKEIWRPPTGRLECQAIRDVRLCQHFQTYFTPTGMRFPFAVLAGLRGAAPSVGLRGIAITLFAAETGFVGCLLATEPPEAAVDHDVDVFRESLDQTPALQERSPALEGQMTSAPPEPEEFEQRPADPEVLLDAQRVEAELASRILARESPWFGREAKVPVHAFSLGSR